MDEEQKNQNTNALEETNNYKNQAEEYLNNWKRERADFINYRKEETKRIAEFVKFANETLILEIIDILDDIEISIKHGSNMEDILKRFYGILSKYGVEKIKTDGKFDPNFHEAIFSESQEPFPEDVSLEGNIQEIRAGYIMNGKVIRPARVKILASKL